LTSIADVCYFAFNEPRDSAPHLHLRHDCDSAGRAEFCRGVRGQKFLKWPSHISNELGAERNTVSVWFSTGYNDRHDCGPDAEGKGKITPKGAIEFTFRDSANNSGSGAITCVGSDIIVSMKTTRVADPRCLVFYRQNMRLKRVK
jgi:hypothetical protein